MEKQAMAMLKVLGIGALAFLYLASPIDIIPDIVPLVGWLDDVGVLGWAWTAIGAAMAETTA